LHQRHWQPPELGSVLGQHEVLTENQPKASNVAGSAPRLEGSMSFITVAVLSVAVIRLAIAWVYPKQANWDE
jgi:hypothetical protein